MRYKTAFQCPDIGYTVVVHYAFGRITMRAADGGEEDPDTLAYVRLHTGKTFRTFEDANQYIIAASEGQSFGFEEE